MKEFTVNGKRYRGVSLLGRGYYSETWLVTDGQAQYALKKIRDSFSDAESDEQLQNSADAYNRLKNDGIPVPALIETDRANRSVLKEYIAGEPVAYLVLRDEMSGECLRQAQSLWETAQAAGYRLDGHSMNYIWTGKRLVYIDYAVYEPLPDPESDSFARQKQYYWSRTPEFARFMLRMTEALYGSEREDGSGKDT